MDLKIVDDIVDMVARVHALARRVARHDRDMADQMKRSSTSVGLNAGEGLYARGGNRTSRLETAMNSGRETILALRMSGPVSVSSGRDGCERGPRDRPDRRGALQAAESVNPVAGRGTLACRARQWKS